MTRLPAVRLRHGGLPIALAVLALAAPASAFERQWHLGGGVGGSLFHFHDQNGGGPTLEGAASYGLTDQLNLLGEATASLVSIKLREDQAHATLDTLTGDVGLAYTLDVLRVVPYAGVLVGAQYLRAGNDFGGALRGERGAQIALDLGIALGVDYQFTRQLATGLALREHLGVAGRDNTSMTTATLRLQYTWGY